MRKLSPNVIITKQMVLVALTVLFALLIVLSFLIIPSSYAPFIILAFIIIGIILVAWIKKPALGLYISLFAVLLPASLIPAQINSYINRIATIFALSIWIIDVIRRRGRLIATPSAILMLFFIIWSAITLSWAEYFSEGINSLLKYVLRLALFLILIVNVIRTKKELDELMLTLALSGWLLVVVSIITIFLQGYVTNTRLRVYDVNENTLGTSLLITLPGVLWWAMHPTNQKSAINKWQAVIFLVALIGLIGLSGSRGSAISLGIVLLSFLIWKPTRFWGLFGLFIVGLGFFFAPMIFSTTIARFLGETGEASLGGREFLWLGGWQLIKDHFLLGVGLGNSEFQVIPYLKSMGAGWVTSDYASIHNPILVIWADTGVSGLILYLGVLVSAVTSFIYHYFQSKKFNIKYFMPYFAIITSVFLGYMASWIKGGSMESDFSYFLMLGMLLIPSHLQSENKKD